MGNTSKELALVLDYLNWTVATYGNVTCSKQEKRSPGGNKHWGGGLFTSFCLSLSDLAWTPLDLVSLITEHIPVQQEQVFWKVLLILPNDDEYAEDDPNR